MMSEKKAGFIDNLWQRRVPQIVGIYIAAVWMAVEIGDWMVERFGLPPSLTSYIFVAMIAMLPALIVVTYGHGAPGKDRWTGLERAVLGINVIVAAAALYLLVPAGSGDRVDRSVWTSDTASENTSSVPPPPTPNPQPAPNNGVAPMAKVTVMDESGVEQEFMVPREGFHRRVGLFILESETVAEDEAWLAYGLPWLMAEDLQRSPLLSANTRLSSPGMQEYFRQRGFGERKPVPRSLALKYASERNYSAALFGRYQRDADGNLVLEVSAIDPETGESLGEAVRASAADWLTAVDSVTSELRDQIAVSNPRSGQLVADERLRDYLSNDFNAVRQLIESFAAVAFDNNYPLAIELANAAAAADPTFADANARLAQLYRLSGRNAEAAAAINAALQHDYKLYSETKFGLQANRYALQQDIPKVLEALKLWTQVHPNSVQAFNLLRWNSMAFGELDVAEQAAKRVLELDPSDLQQLRALAQIQTMRGDLEGAQRWLEQYMEQKPADVGARLQLARNKIRQGLLGQARSDFEAAALIDSNNLAGELGVADLDIRAGQFNRANQRLLALLERANTDRQRVEVLQVYANYYLTNGQIGKLIDTYLEMETLAASYDVPISVIFTYSFPRAFYHAAVGQFDTADSILAKLEEELEPPFDDYLAFGHMAVAEKTEDRARYEAAFGRIKAFNEQISNPLNDSFLLAGDAQLAVWDGDFGRSANLFEQAIEQLSTSVVGAESMDQIDSFGLKLAQCARMAGNFDSAAGQLDELLQRFPVWPEARIERARVLIGQSSIAEARSELDEVLATLSSADDSYDLLNAARSLRTELNDGSAAVGAGH